MTTPFDPSKTTPQEAHALIQKVATIVGLDPDSTFDAVDAALDALFAAAGDRGAQVAANAARMCTPEELAACRAQGCSPADFLALKHGR